MPPVDPRDTRFHPDGGARALGTDAGVRVRWLGTAGFEIRAGDHRLLIDPYLTRASFARCALARLEPDVSVITRTIDRADAIVVGHTHFDHALDVPTLARLTGAAVFGSRSAASLCRLDGVAPDRIRDVESSLRNGAFTAEVGPFELRFFPSAHSKLLFGRKVPFEGDVTDCDEVPLRATGYRCGAVFGVEIRVAGRSIYHVGSAELVEDALPRREVDLLLFCVAGWQSSPGIVERAVSRTSPRAVLLSHWDDFFRPLDAPVRALPGVQLPRVIDRFHAAARDVRVGTLDLLGEIAL